MNRLQTDLIKLTNTIPYYYLQDLLDYAKFLKQKSERETDAEYLENIPGMADAIVEAAKEDLQDCSKTLDW